MAGTRIVNSQNQIEKRNGLPLPIKEYDATSPFDLYTGAVTANTGWEGLYAVQMAEEEWNAMAPHEKLPYEVEAQRTISYPTDCARRDCMDVKYMWLDKHNKVLTALREEESRRKTEIKALFAENLRLKSEITSLKSGTQQLLKINDRLYTKQEEDSQKMGNLIKQILLLKMEKSTLNGQVNTLSEQLKNSQDSGRGSLSSHSSVADVEDFLDDADEATAESPAVEQQRQRQQEATTLTEKNDDRDGAICH